MIKTLLLVVFLTSGIAFGQLTENKYHLTAKYGLGTIDNALYNSFSLSGECIIHDYIGLNYNLDLLLRNDQITHFHTPMGIGGGPLVILGSINSFFNDEYGRLAYVGIVAGFIMLILPDGVSFHIPASYRIDVSPYANFLGIDFVQNKNKATDQLRIKYACSFGVKTSYLFKEKYNVSAFLETRRVAGYYWGFGGGLGIGYGFKTR